MECEDDSALEVLGNGMIGIEIVSPAETFVFENKLVYEHIVRVFLYLVDYLPCLLYPTYAVGRFLVQLLEESFRFRFADFHMLHENGKPRRIIIPPSCIDDEIYLAIVLFETLFRFQNICFLGREDGIFHKDYDRKI